MEEQERSGQQAEGPRTARFSLYQLFTEIYHEGTKEEFDQFSICGVSTHQQSDASERAST